ncbi:MAG TPA: hypothetical protein EYP86_02870 [Candidatus Altiarchaeales archaeon]|nr:hypothetical protein [Candidatus Altiarchaeales archaeon]
MDEETKQEKISNELEGSTRIETKEEDSVIPEPKPTIQSTTDKSRYETPPQKLEKLEGTVIVEFHIREGEYSPVCRFQFPSNEHLFRLLDSAPLEERKKYNFYLFNKVLIANKYSRDVFDFLQKSARNVGFNIEFKERGK